MKNNGKYSTVRKNGNSLYALIPKDIVDLLGLEKGSDVYVKSVVLDGKTVVVVEKLKEIKKNG